jgi:hypothetical protein
MAKGRSTVLPLNRKIETLNRAYAEWRLTENWSDKATAAVEFAKFAVANLPEAATFTIEDIARIVRPPQ